MQALPIVEGLDELKDRGLCVVPSLEGLLIDKYVFVNVLKKRSTTALSGEEVHEMQTIIITSMAKVPGGRAKPMTG